MCAAIKVVLLHLLVWFLVARTVHLSHDPCLDVTLR